VTRRGGLVDASEHTADIGPYGFRACHYPVSLTNDGSLKTARCDEVSVGQFQALLFQIRYSKEANTSGSSALNSLSSVSAW
jgi:hypothetical protein